MYRVFVYGTLMKGFSSHNVLRGAKFMGTARLDGFGLYCVTPYYPGIIRKAGSAVRGEVFEADDAVMERLDGLEDEGILYTRECGPCTMEDGTVLDAYYYCWLSTPDERDYLPFEQTPWHPGVMNETSKRTGKK